ncbi:MAG: 30S ribosomal protein S8 [Candidatus Nealsonbacteria bacterium]|nr:30S ribosomal protein S8 [Candidatus Nealsonbacteria bacterium]
MTDPIADMFNRIRNAQMAGKPLVSVPFSNIKFNIAQILEKNQFVDKVDKRGRKVDKFIDITLKYDNKTPVISGIKKFSKPGQRIYLSFGDIKMVKGGYGIAIISTPKGLMTNKEARRQKMGGELICEVW